MTDSIRTGTMLIKDGIAMPESLVVGTEHYSPGWSSVMGATSSELDKQIEGAGWTFFYMAGEIHTTGFGFNDQSRTDRAVAHAIDVVKRESCNCLEITQMRRRSFLGLPYTSLVAHARHIQRSRSFYGQSSMPVGIPFSPREWLYDQTSPARSQPLVAAEAVHTWENEGGLRAEGAS